jgi:hypothetical protein
MGGTRGGASRGRMGNREGRRRMPPADDRAPAALGYGPATAGGGRRRVTAGAARHRAVRGPADEKRSSARTGAIIVATASSVAAVLVVVILNFDAGAGARQSAQDAAIMAPVTDLGTLARRYAAIAEPIDQQLTAEIGRYDASEDSDLAAARSALQAEVTTERSFDSSLATWLAAWKNDYGAAKALQANGVSDPDEPVIIDIRYSSAVAKTAEALLTADQSGESLTARQAQARTLSGMRSLNGAHQVASNAVEAQAALLRRELHLPPA